MTLPLLHGHVHGAWRVKGRQFNVGLDVNGLRPVHLDEVAALLTSPEPGPKPPV